MRPPNLSLALPPSLKPIHPSILPLWFVRLPLPSCYLDASFHFSNSDGRRVRPRFEERGFGGEIKAAEALLMDFGARFKVLNAERYPSLPHQVTRDMIWSDGHRPTERRRIAMSSWRGRACARARPLSQLPLCSRSLGSPSLRPSFSPPTYHLVSLPRRS